MTFEITGDLRALEKVLDVRAVWSFLGVGITWKMVSGALCGEINPRSAFLDHSWALFQVREKIKNSKKLSKSSSQKS